METAFEKSVLEFSLPLYQAFDKKGNEFMSPYSLSAALMLLLLGTDGETKSGLESALNIQKMNDSDAHLCYNILHKKLTDRLGKGILVSIANKIFSKQGVTLKKTFNDNSLKFYGSEIELLEFDTQAEESRTQINSWIEKETNGKIKDLIPQGLLNGDTMMVLTNAIYFKGDWEFKFKESRTSKQPFYINDTKSVEVDMMSTEAYVMSEECIQLDCKCLQLPYKGDTLSMAILLPNKRTGLESLECKLSVMTIQNAISNTQQNETLIVMPKFRIEAEYDLKRILSNLVLLE